MKKYILFYFILILFLSKAGFSQNYYDKTYSFGYYDNPFAMTTDSLGNIIVCGWYSDESSEKTMAFALKVNPNGEELWRITLEDTSKYYALCVTSTGNIALAGSKNRHSYLSMINGQSGNEIWSIEDSSSTAYWFASVNEVLDSGIYKLHAVKCKYGPRYQWYYLFDTQTGAYLYDKHGYAFLFTGLVYTSNLVSPSVVWTAGDLMCLSSDTTVCKGLIDFDNFGVGDSGMWLFLSQHVAGVDKYSDTEGCVVRLFEWDPGEYFMGVLVMTLGDLTVYGNAFDILHDTFTVTGSGMLGEDKILVTGTIDNNLSLWMIKHDLTGMEEEIIPTGKPRSGVDVIGLTTMDMVLMGTEEEGNGATDVFLMKLNYNGTVSTEENTISEDFTVYPNPAKDKLWIKTNKTKMQHTQVCIVNTVGKTVCTSTGLNNPVSLSGLSQGLYVVLVMNNNKVVYRQKFIKY